MRCRGTAVAALVAALTVVGCKETLLHNLDERQANSVRLVLAKAGIEATKSETASGWDLSVDDEEVTRALEALDAAHIEFGAKGADADDSTGFITSQEERANRLDRDRASRLEETLERLPYVDEARVHVHRDAAERYSWDQAPSRASGSVLILASDPTKIQVPQIQKLISGAAGVPPEA
ncbi:MAG: hypothetical protein KDD44_12660, partial [Bdellovibrionales bacterium]|nr:hypothetical protein [Bdellovibrionales bacterium]